MHSQSDDDFVQYVSARLRRLHHAAYLMCGEAHRADDLVQSTLVSLYTQWRHARTAANLDAYVHRILARRFIDEKRSAWSRVLLPGQLPDAAEPDRDAYVERDAVVTALRTLPAGQRAVIVLRYYSDLSVEETARALGCSTGNVKSQCARGLATLRAGLSGTAAGHERSAELSHRPSS
jgi:RNA polymerase sigma-70 factor (sigma-E family)